MRKLFFLASLMAAALNVQKPFGAVRNGYAGECARPRRRAHTI
jgi:hypothetical protein